MPAFSHSSAESFLCELDKLQCFDVPAWIQILVPTLLESVSHIHLPFKVSCTWKTFTHCKHTIFKSLFLVITDPRAVLDEDERNAWLSVACWGCTILCWCSQRCRGTAGVRAERGWTPFSFY